MIWRWAEPGRGDVGPQGPPSACVAWGSGTSLRCAIPPAEELSYPAAKRSVRRKPPKPGRRYIWGKGFVDGEARQCLMQLGPSNLKSRSGQACRGRTGRGGQWPARARGLLLQSLSWQETTGDRRNHGTIAENRVCPRDPGVGRAPAGRTHIADPFVAHGRPCRVPCGQR